MKNIYLALLCLLITGAAPLVAQGEYVGTFELEDDTGRRKTGTLEFFSLTNGRNRYREPTLSDTTIRVEYNSNMDWIVVATIKFPPTETKPNGFSSALIVFQGAEGSGMVPPDYADGNYKTARTGWKLHQLTFQPKPPELNLQVAEVIKCNGGSDGSLTVSVTGGAAPYTYAWSDGTTETDVGSENHTLTGLAAATYQVTVTDANGGTATAALELTEPEMIIGTVATTDVSCYGASDGSVTVSVTGGTGDYSYMWSDAGKSTTPTVTGLEGGAYSVRILDERKCVGLAFETVREPDTLTIDTSLIKDTGAGDGVAMARATGGTAPYTYAWNSHPDVTTGTLTGLSSGRYEVAVTDDNGCTAAASITMTEYLPGEACAVAIGIDSLLGGAPGAEHILEETDNTDYSSVKVDGPLLVGCYAKKDSLYHPVFYRFTGDGNSYRMWTKTDDSESAIPGGDTRALLIGGNCTTAQILDCNEDAGADDPAAMLEFQTEAGANYLVLIDGGSSVAAGTYSLHMARFETTAVTAAADARTATVYPNPTTGRFRIGGVDVASVTVFDGYGRQLLQQSGRGADVDLGDLPRGVYTLYILDRQQAAYTTRVVKE
ncbi:T9SS type A sorting domain-containing protein [Lewinella sp. IMCC34183]|uniref:T9SS type A sorting domain-containing protein n=1 Tax=Lewinella sp. IMCC34183 TaxID=2248762 RepID=UPI000E2471BF|nr:T9SS type A sorting domain-containing protein [Lewinella sp. IMCC34183]